jgi:hypothetical protein
MDSHCGTLVTLATLVTLVPKLCLGTPLFETPFRDHTTPPRHRQSELTSKAPGNTA